MVLLRPSILAFSSWCCLIIPSRAIRSLRNTDRFFLVTLTPSQNIFKKESWQFYFLNSCLAAILVSLCSSISDVIVLAAIVCKSVKEQKIHTKISDWPILYQHIISHWNLFLLYKQIQKNLWSGWRDTIPSGFITPAFIYYLDECENILTLHQTFSMDWVKTFGCQS